MSARGVARGLLLAAVALRLAAPEAGLAQTRPTKAQAGAAVVVYKQVREQCAAEGPTCDVRAKRQFVEIMNCVALGRRGVDPATLDRDFTSYVDMLSDVLEGQETSPATEVGPCFAAAPAGKEEAAEGQGPTVESLRRFRKQAEEQSRPVPPTGDRGSPSAHERLKAELEAMRTKVRGGLPGVPAPPVPK